MNLREKEGCMLRKDMTARLQFLLGLMSAGYTKHNHKAQTMKTRRTDVQRSIQKNYHGIQNSLKQSM